MSSKVFVGNLSFHTSKEQLTELLSGAGQIVNVHIPTDRNTGQPRGFAFVEFLTEVEAGEAIKRFDGQELDGRELRVSEAQERQRRGGHPHSPGPSDSGHRRDGYGGNKRRSKSKGSRRGIRRRKRSL